MSFVLGQSGYTLRDHVTFDIPDIFIFPWFIVGIGLLVLAAILSLLGGPKKKLFIKISLAALMLLALWSLVQGHYHSKVAMREAIFSPMGIGIWLGFLFVLPASSERFWVYFKKHILHVLKLLLLLEFFAIMLMLSGNRGLIRVNFSTSISLFILTWGLFSSDKRLTVWGLIGSLVFLFHSFIHNQRETFLLPLEYMMLFLPIYFGRTSVTVKKNLFSKIIGLIIFIYFAGIGITAFYAYAPEKYFKLTNKSNLTEDTRSLVFRDYMESDMNQSGNYLFGKGVNGYYKSKIRYSAIGGADTSDVIEIGYLQMVLNVGLIYVIIMILMGFFPAIWSLFKSRNPLVIAASLWVLIRLINMVLAAKPMTDCGWFLFWMCIGVINAVEISNSDKHSLRLTKQRV